MNAAVLLGACACSVLQCLLLAIVVELFLRAVPRLDAATRHRVWLLVVAVAIALPLVDLAVRANPGAHTAQPARALAAFVLAEPLAFGALALWSIVSIVFLARLAASLTSLLALRRRSASAPSDVASRVAQRARELGIRVPVSVRTSGAIATPMCVGFVRGTILIPQRLLQTLSNDEIDFVLVHELAHVRRYDGVSNLFAKVVRSVLIWNPVMLFVERRMAFERELACDDVVVALCGRAQRYARCLATVMLSSGAPSAAVPFARSARQGLRRIELLLAGSRRAFAPPRFMLVAIAGGIALALTVAASAPQFIALDVPQPAAASQSAADFAPARSVVVPAAFQISPAVMPSAAPFATARLFALKT
jgi:beta-lactamase regulating signal transducer with metallopeptidase domain